EVDALFAPVESALRIRIAGELPDLAEAALGGQHEDVLESARVHRGEGDALTVRGEGGIAGLDDADALQLEAALVLDAEGRLRVLGELFESRHVEDVAGARAADPR